MKASISTFVFVLLKGRRKLPKDFQKGDSENLSRSIFLVFILILINMKLWRGQKLGMNMLLWLILTETNCMFLRMLLAYIIEII